MSATKDYHFKSRVFAAGEMKRCMERILTSIFGSKYDLRVSLYRTLADGTKQSESDLNASALESICDLAQERVSILLVFGKKESGHAFMTRDLEVRLKGDPDGFVDVSVDSESVQTISAFAEAMQRELALETAPTPSERTRQKVRDQLTKEGRKPLYQEIDDLRVRLETLEAQQVVSRTLTCFLSFQFSGPSLEYGRQVKNFLELLGVNVITGQGYEPKPISEKVRSRLSEKLDMVVVIEVADRKSSWTRDEMARAQSPGVFLIPLVEEGASFDRGIYGDHEFIHFAPGHISDAFIGLTEGVNYVRRVLGSGTKNESNVA